MQNVYATALDITPTDEAGFATVASKALAWATRTPEGSLDPLTSGDFSGGEARTTSWTVLGEATGGPQAIRITLEHPDGRHRGITWRASLDIVGNGGCIRVTVRLLRGSTDVFVAPAPITDLRAPGIVGTLLRQFDCRLGGLPVTGEAQLLYAGDVDEFIDKVIASNERRLPVVVLSRPPGASGLQENANRIAARLAGIAHVAALSGWLADQRAFDRLQPDQWVPHGGVRIFWPGFGDGKLRNPFWTRARLQQMDSPIEDIAFSLISRTASVGVPEDPIVRNLRRQQFAPSDDGLIPFSEVEMLLKENDELREDKARLIAELQTAHENLQSIQNATATEESSPAELSSAPTTWDEFADLLPSRAHPGIVFTDRCVAGVRGCEYRDVTRMWEFVESLSAAAEDFYLLEGQIGKRLGEWLHTEYGLEYAHHDDSLRRKSKAEFEFEGRTLDRSEHIKVDDNKKPNECGRIYFAQDQARFIVDHIGLHL
jgi:hypothetical protein